MMKRFLILFAFLAILPAYAIAATQNGSNNVAAAGSLTGTTLASNVTASSLTSFGGSLALGTPASGTLTNTTGFPASALAGSTLASGVTASSLTSLGTIVTGVWHGTAIAPTYGGTGFDSSSSTGIGQWASGTYSVSTALASGTTATTQAASDSSTKVATTAFTANAKIRTIGFSVTNPTTGQQGSYVVFPVAGTITGWAIVADTGTATVQTWKVASGTAAPTVANSISTSGVALSTGTAIISSTTSDFTTTTISANDILAFNISAVSGATKLFFMLQIRVN